MPTAPPERQACEQARSTCCEFRADNVPVADLKTKPTRRSVEAYLDAIEDASRRQDCRQLAKLMVRVTGCQPVMWGTSIVGFDSYHYKYASGREGDWCVVGFSSRKGDISIYLMSGFEGLESLLAALGRHKLGKACLYVRRLADIDMPVLEQLVAASAAQTRRRHPTRAQADR
jgi:hypothetical protein